MHNFKRCKTKPFSSEIDISSHLRECCWTKCLGDSRHGDHLTELPPYIGMSLTMPWHGQTPCHGMLKDGMVGMVYTMPLYKGMVAD